SCSLSTSISNCMSFVNPTGVRMAKFFGSSSRLISTIFRNSMDIGPLLEPRLAHSLGIRPCISALPRWVQIFAPMPESNKDLVRWRTVGFRCEADISGRVVLANSIRAPLQDGDFRPVPAMSPGLRSEQPLAIISWRELAKEGGSHAAPLGRPGNCRRQVKWAPGRGTGQLAVQADNRDRSVRRWRQYRWPRSNLFSAAIRTSRPAVRDRKSSGRRKHNRHHELGEGRTG